jgi:hypothetical protein
VYRPIDVKLIPIPWVMLKLFVRARNASSVVGTGFDEPYQTSQYLQLQDLLGYPICLFPSPNTMSVRGSVSIF